MKHQKFNCDVERVTPLEGNDLQTVVTFSRPPVCPLLVKMASIICFRHFSLSLPPPPPPSSSSSLLLPTGVRACLFVFICETQFPELKFQKRESNGATCAALIKKKMENIGKWKKKTMGRGRNNENEPSREFIYSLDILI